MNFFTIWTESEMPPCADEKLTLTSCIFDQRSFEVTCCRVEVTRVGLEVRGRARIKSLICQGRKKDTPTPIRLKLTAQSPAALEYIESAGFPSSSFENEFCFLPSSRSHVCNERSHSTLMMTWWPCVRSPPVSPASLRMDAARDPDRWPITPRRFPTFSSCPSRAVSKRSRATDYS